jgi:hypothetical protein
MLQSSGQISIADIVLELRPDDTTAGSGIKPFSFSALAPYSTNSATPYGISEWYSQSLTYNTSRYIDFGYTWAASPGDILETRNEIPFDVGGPGFYDQVITISNSGFYKIRFYFVGSGGDITSNGFNISFNSVLDIGLTQLPTDGFTGTHFVSSTQTINLQVLVTDVSAYAPSTLYCRIMRVS